jgi:hypothetical protein
MPCRDDWPTTDFESKENARIEAALCAVLTLLEKDWTPDEFTSFFNDIDWEEAGVTKKWLVNWWNKHKARDQERRNREARERAKNAMAKKARSKLTKEEFEALRENFHDDWMTDD